MSYTESDIYALDPMLCLLGDAPPPTPSLRGAVPNWRGFPFPAWEDVDEIEKQVQYLGSVIGSWRDAELAVIRLISMRQSVNKSEILKEICALAEVHEEHKHIAPVSISARQARRAAIAKKDKFSAQFRKSLNKNYR